MLTIYHNPRCSKSRLTLQLLKDQGLEPEVIEYIKSPLPKAQLKKLLGLLDLSVRELIRTSEADYKDNNLKDPHLTDDHLLDAMVRLPKLMQRPIVVNGDKAAIGRPPEAVLEIL